MRYCILLLTCLELALGVPNVAESQPTLSRRTSPKPTPPRPPPRAHNSSGAKKSKTDTQTHQGHETARVFLAHQEKTARKSADIAVKAHAKSERFGQIGRNVFAIPSPFIPLQVQKTAVAGKVMGDWAHKVSGSQKQLYEKHTQIVADAQAASRPLLMAGIKPAGYSPNAPPQGRLPRPPKNPPLRRLSSSSLEDGPGIDMANMPGPLDLAPGH